MGKSSVQFASSAAKEFRSLPEQIQERVSEAVEKLRLDPFPPGARKLVGPGKLYRLRIGSYRLVYRIEESGIFITRIRHRKDAYR
jgi:mRNA interferase RelE/StbE